MYLAARWRAGAAVLQRAAIDGRGRRGNTAHRALKRRAVEADDAAAIGARLAHPLLGGIRRSQRQDFLSAVQESNRSGERQRIDARPRNAAGHVGERAAEL